MADQIRDDILSLRKEICQLRREFHRYPELGFEEVRTSQIVAGYLGKLGIGIQTNIAKTGVVGLLPGKGEGKTLLIRADMDALPIEEKNEVPYRSAIRGLMHACGHDGHMAMCLAAAKLLWRYRERFHGQIKFVFEPGEEGFGGGKEMIDAGILENPKVDAAVALHLTNSLMVGTVGTCVGPILSSMDTFTLTILGKAAHAGMPDEGVDAILISSYLISALQSLISKETSPLAQLVVHVGTIRGGEAFNVVAGQVQLKGTIRTLDDGLRKSCPERMDRIARGIVEALRGKHQLEYKALYPTTINDKAMTAFVLNQAKRVVGSSNVMRLAPIMASDDIGFFLQKVPGCFMFVGSSNAQKGYIQPAHSPLFDFDEDSLLIGTEILIRTALAYLMGTSFLVGNEVNGSTGTDTTH